jgi:hypothetical protein
MDRSFHPREAAVKVYRQLAVDFVGFVWSRERAYHDTFFRHSDLSHVAVFGGAKMHAFETALVAFGHPPVPDVLRVAAWTKIKQAIVRAVGIPVIDIFGFYIVNQFHDYTCRYVGCAADLHVYNGSVVPTLKMGVSGYFSGLTAIDQFPGKVGDKVVSRAKLPSKYARGIVIIKTFLKEDLGRQLRSRRHTRRSSFTASNTGG